jgi:hypothetical protein
VYVFPWTLSGGCSPKIVVEHAARSAAQTGSKVHVVVFLAPGEGCSMPTKLPRFDARVTTSTTR